MRGRWAAARGAGGALGIVATAVLTSWTPAGSAPRRTALTLSGLRAAPYAKRSVRVGGVGVRFRAPASTELAAVALAWERPGADCTLDLHADAAGAPAALLARTDIRATSSWTTTSLSTALVAGEIYHLVVRCGATAGRLAYVLDHAPAAASQSWQLEDLRRPRVRTHEHASPLFVLTFADGTAWGQPYESSRQRLRLCGPHEVAATIVPAVAMTVERVELPIGRRHLHQGFTYTLTTADGSAVLSGHSGGDATPTPVGLIPGTAYTLRLRAPRRHGCLRVGELSTGLHLGAPLSGLATTSVSGSRDGGRTWQAVAAETLAAQVVLADPVAPGSTTTTLPGTPTSPGRSISAAGFLGAYDGYGQTVVDWPRKLALIEADGGNDGPRVAAWKQASAAAGNLAASYWFYTSLTSIDSRCQCRDQRMYERLTAREDFWLHDASGRRISTFVGQLGVGRQIATDVGNPAFVDAWTDYQLATLTTYGWDGVWTDNIVCAWDVGTSWSAVPVNPRTHAPYTLAEYRRDLATALERIHGPLAAAGKRLLGNHGGSCVADFATDANVQRQLLAMDGTAIENCVYDFWDAGCGCNRPHPERTYLDQLRYLRAAPRAAPTSVCSTGATSSTERF